MVAVTEDDHVLELAVAARARHIVTFNLKDFVGVENFNLTALTPKALLPVPDVEPEEHDKL